MERVTGFSFQRLPAFPFQSGTEVTRARCRSSALKSRSRVFSEHAAATIRIYFAPPSARFAGIWIIQRSNESRKDTAAKFCRSKIFLCRSLPFPLLFFFKSAPNAKCYKQSFARRRNTRRTPHSTIRFMQVFAAGKIGQAVTPRHFSNIPFFVRCTPADQRPISKKYFVTAVIP